MKLAFAGTPEFAAVILDALIDSAHPIDAVFTRPDSRSGRGNRLTESAVKRRAIAAGIGIQQPRTLRGATAEEVLSKLEPDALIVAAYGLLMPDSILAIPRLGCINVHASILPRWRGASPVHHAILAGDSHSGVSIVQMDSGLDSGPLLATRGCAIGPEDTAGSLTSRLADLGAATLVDTLAALENGLVEPRAQNEACATFAPKLSKSKAAVEWTLPAAVIERSIRAFNPWPVAHTYVSGGTTPAFRIWRARAVGDNSACRPGTVIRCDDSGVLVATAQGALNIAEIQLPAGRRMSAAEFARGRRLAPGILLGPGPQ